jgi:hypothetical protein
MRGMNDDSARQAALAALQEQMDAIHYANKLYWDQLGHSREADMAYYEREERLGQLRKEIDELPKLSWPHLNDAVFSLPHFRVLKRESTVSSRSPI